MGCHSEVISGKTQGERSYGSGGQGTQTVAMGHFGRGRWHIGQGVEGRGQRGMDQDVRSGGRRQGTGV